MNDEVTQTAGLKASLKRLPVELFSLPCSTCGARLKVKSLSAIGQIFNCPKCQSMVLVEPPPGWKPPSVESKAAARAEPLPAASEASVATVEPLSDMTWQSPVEARWQSGVWVAVASIAVLMVVGAGWWLWPRNDSTQALIVDAPPSVEAPQPLAQPESVQPAAAVPTVEAASAPQVPEPVLPRRWLPAETRMVLSLRLAELAAHELAPEILASGSSPLRHTLAELHTTFQLDPEQVRRITWAVTDASTDLRCSAVVIELVEPLEDEATLLAGCRRLEQELGVAFCHQPRAGGWPHPFAVVDAQTIVTGPSVVLSEIGRHVEAPQESQPFKMALAVAEDDSLVLVVDLRQWSALEQVAWPAEIATRLGALKSWPVLRDSLEAATLQLQMGQQPAAELNLVCRSAESAAEVRTALNDVVAELGQSFDAVQVAVEENIVACRMSLEGDSRLLAAGLMTNLPKWAAPVQPIEPLPATPAPTTVATEPPANSPTPFERQVTRQFDERIASISLRGMKLVDFSSLVSRMTGVSLVMDEQRLAEAGLSGQTTIDVQLTSATLGEVLSAALAGRELDFLVQENRVLITTRAHAAAARQERAPNQPLRPIQ